MKRLVFGEGLMAQPLGGGVHFTIRRYREGVHDFAKDEIVVGEFKDGLDILLRITVDTKKDTFRRLKSSKKNMATSGYWFDRAYFQGLAAYYPAITWDEIGAIIFFEILKVNGVPVASLNEHAK